MRTTSDTAAAIGLAIGGAFGLAGTFVASAPLRETLWTIDGVALVVATALLTMKYQRLGNDCVAAGFLTFLAGQCGGLEASVLSYVGGITLRTNLPPAAGPRQRDAEAARSGSSRRRRAAPLERGLADDFRDLRAAAAQHLEIRRVQRQE